LSSPIAKIKKSPLDKFLINLHQKVSHNHRINILSENIGLIIKNIFLDKDEIKLLDVGCGDMSLVEKMMQSDNRITSVCLDVYPLPDKYKNDVRWKKYLQFDGKNIPFPNNYFDIAILSDVLHHDFTNSYNILKESIRVSNYVLVKDHFEFGIYSRLMLKLMDIIGNWGYGVTIPKKYFNKFSFMNLLRSLNINEENRIENINLYSHNYLLNKILRPSWQFISLLKKKESVRE
jgi:SAM-dependent methyltransferase